MTVNELAELLSRIEPNDAGTAERMDKHWGDANRYAAEEVLKNMPDFGDRVLPNTAQTRASEAAYYIAIQGRRRRNEYLAKVVDV